MASNEKVSVYWVNGRCFTCGGTARMNVRQAWCRGCGAEVGSIGWAPEGSLDAERVAALAAAYDARQEAPPAAGQQGDVNGGT